MLCLIKVLIGENIDMQIGAFSIVKQMISWQNVNGETNG